MSQKRMECFRLLCMNQASVFEWHKRFKEGSESVSDDERCGGSKELSISLLKMGQWHFHQDNAPVHNSVLVIDYLTKIGIKTVLHSPYSQTLLPVTFGYSLSSEAVVMRQLRRWEAVKKVIDTLTHFWKKMDFALNKPQMLRCIKTKNKKQKNKKQTSR